MHVLLLVEKSRHFRELAEIWLTSAGLSSETGTLSIGLRSESVQQKYILPWRGEVRSIFEQQCNLPPIAFSYILFSVSRSPAFHVRFPEHCLIPTVMFLFGFADLSVISLPWSLQTLVLFLANIMFFFSSTMKFFFIQKSVIDWMFIFPQIHMLKPKLQCDVTSKRGLWEVLRFKWSL